MHTAWRRATADGWSHVILDGTPIDCDRLAPTTPSANGHMTDARCSGKHRTFGYETAGHGTKTPTKQPVDVYRHAPDNQLLRSLRWQGERGSTITDRRRLPAA